MNIAIVSGSLHPRSRSFVLARHCQEALSSRSADADLIDLRDYQLPLHTGTGDCKTPDVLALSERMQAVGSVFNILSSPRLSINSLFVQVPPRFPVCVRRLNKCTCTRASLTPRVWWADAGRGRHRVG